MATACGYPQQCSVYAWLMIIDSYWVENVSQLSPFRDFVICFLWKDWYHLFRGGVVFTGREQTSSEAEYLAWREAWLMHFWAGKQENMCLRANSVYPPYLFWAALFLGTLRPLKINSYTCNVWQGLVNRHFFDLSSKPPKKNRNHRHRDITYQNRSAWTLQPIKSKCNVCVWSNVCICIGLLYICKSTSLHMRMEPKART